jgi:NAD(P)-dependent dehydrogenase (short-subunit alcohol dehydrogenase family)
MMSPCFDFSGFVKMILCSKYIKMAVTKQPQEQETFIQVNAIGLGAFPPESQAGTLDGKKLDLIRREKIPMGREGRPEELDPLVVYLASSASDYVTGETIFIDGGESARL